MKCFTVIGARPQFIKAAAVSRELAAAGIDEVLVHTGQHFDAGMSDIFFSELGIPAPKHNLGLGGGRHGEMTGRMLEGVERLLESEKPDCLLVYGDTNSTLAGSLAAAKLHIPVVHVEAGLRSFNRRMPEEVNRVLTDHVSALLLCSSDVGVKNLADEGVTKGVHVIGDVMADAVMWARSVVDSEPAGERLGRIGLRNSAGYCLMTLHRAENTDDLDRFRSILDGIRAAGRPMVWPIHPRASALLERTGIELPENIEVIAPVGYLDMAALIAAADLVVTDSGGLQKEAYWFDKPCITMRDDTEWVETIEAGWSVLVGADAGKIERSIVNPPRGAEHPELYGDGHAAGRIPELIIETLGK